MRTLIIIPAYNEQESILRVVEDVVSAGYDYVVINDGSTDDTKRICDEHDLNCVTLPRNLGIGGAVQTGHLYALREGYDIDIQIDGDGQHDISYAHRLVEAIKNGADIAIGSRFLEPSDGFQSTFMRRAGIRWLSSCIKLICHKEIFDVTSGFRASGRKAIELFAHRYPSDYPEPESIVTAINHGLAVAEVPVNMRERQGGTSSIGTISSMYYMIKVTLAIFIERMGSKTGGTRR